MSVCQDPIMLINCSRTSSTHCEFCCLVTSGLRITQLLQSMCNMLLTAPSFNLESSECSSPVIRKCTVVSQLYSISMQGKQNRLKKGVKYVFLCLCVTCSSPSTSALTGPPHILLSLSGRKCSRQLGGSVWCSTSLSCLAVVWPCAVSVCLFQLPFWETLLWMRRTCDHLKWTE